MLCCLHYGLLAAGQAQSKSTVVVNTSPIQALINQGKRLRDTGHPNQAIAKFRQARELARTLNNADYEAKSLILMGYAQTLVFKYGAALDSLDQAVDIGRNNDLIAGSASGSMADLYWQLGDYAAAEAQSKYAIQRLKRITNPNPYATDCLSKVLMIHASLCFQMDRISEGSNDYRDALSIATNKGDLTLQARIWDEQGVQFMHKHRVAAANDSFQKAISLSTGRDDLDGLAFEKEHLAELELQKDRPDCSTALRLLDEAFATPSPSFKSSPQYYPINIRAKILLRSGNKSQALSEFLRAVNAANQWRQGALPGDTTNTQTVAQLQEVYADYAQLAADMSLQRKDKALAINALEVLIENRASSLHERLQAVYGNNGQLPDEYFAKLSELQSAQAAVTLGHDSSQDQAKLIQIRLDISNLENKIGIKSGKVSALTERIPRRNSLRDIQHTLGRDQVLISITLGKCQSYLWAVTGGVNSSGELNVSGGGNLSAGVNLYRLPGEAELTSKADSFASAIRLGHDPSASADSLTRALFENLPADVWNRSEWMMVADGPLLNGIPFCALNDLAPGHAGKRLVESKTLRFLPSELLLTDRRQSNPPRTFVGVGDPIYNQADSRVSRSRSPDAKTLSDTVTLARLVGSEKEIKAAAREVQPVQALLLTGAAATRENLAAALAKDPGVVHFAVHVVSPPNRPQEAALALSLRNNGLPELLTPEAIASFRVPGSLVVLSGCSSGLGKVVPGAGLVGLSRAWLLAGAAAVVVSAWPTPDDSGKFFSSFYDHFNQTTSGDTAQRAALALRQAQLDMLHGSGYKASPNFWGAFAVVAKE